MKFDSYARFVKSPLYRECLLAEAEGRPAGTWLLAPRQPRHHEKGAHALLWGAVSRCRSAGVAHGRPEGWHPAQCHCLPCVLQKPKLKPGKSLPLGVEELGQLPPAEGRPLRKSFRRGEGRSGPQR